MRPLVCCKKPLLQTIDLTIDSGEQVVFYALQVREKSCLLKSLLAGMQLLSGQYLFQGVPVTAATVPTLEGH